MVYDNRRGEYWGGGEQAEGKADFLMKQSKYFEENLSMRGWGRFIRSLQPVSLMLMVRWVGYNVTWPLLGFHQDRYCKVCHGAQETTAATNQQKAMEQDMLGQDTRTLGSKALWIHREIQSLGPSALPA